MINPLEKLQLGLTSVADSVYWRGRQKLAEQLYFEAAEDFRMALTLGTQHYRQAELLRQTCRAALTPRESIQLN